jgi:hypothetical protein
MIAVAAALLFAASPATAAGGIGTLLHQTHWGESAADLQRQFVGSAIALPQPLDFGDSYARLVLPHARIGSVPMVVFLQMNKPTHDLKRIQFERPPHGVNPPAFRAIAAALDAEFGRPDRICRVRPRPASGWQAAVEEFWVHGDATIGAIFRDTTLQAFEGCFLGPAGGWCGLRGQILVRLGPRGRGAGPCG